MLKSITLIVLLLTLANINLFANDTFIISPVQKNRGTASINDRDAYEALVLAINLSKKYNAVAYKKVDSLISTSYLRKRLNINELAQKTGANKILFPSISVLNNMIRVEIKEKNVGKNIINKNGIGYSLLNYRDIENDKPIYVPTLISAFQRAFMNLVNDSTLYESYDNLYKIYPAKTLAISGLEFIDNEDYKKWYLFDEKQLMSFDMIETIFDVVAYHHNYVVYDTPSRDTLFSFFNIYETANHTAPSKTELTAFKNIGVESFISGSVERERMGVKITLNLFDLEEGIYKKNKTASFTIEEDKLSEIRFGVRMATVKLLFDTIDGEKLKEIERKRNSDRKDEETVE
jgi:hypothetical protein